jgi:toluene monooxygenase system protein D
MSSSTMVGPIVRCGDVADAVAEAAVIDNPNRDVTVEDHTAYLRVQCADECVIRRDTMQETLGRPFEMRELEVNLASFAGQIETTTDHVRFFVSGRPS